MAHAARKGQRAEEKVGGVSNMGQHPARHGANIRSIRSHGRIEAKGMPREPFRHRANFDRTYDSVCIGCFRTIATDKTEQELERAEKLHVCKGLDLLPAYTAIQPSRSTA